MAAVNQHTQPQCEEECSVGPPIASKNCGAQLLVSGPAVGLVNLGNTCFFNSALQLLLACPHLNGAASACCGPSASGSNALANIGGGSSRRSLGRGPLGFALQQALLNVNGAHSGGQQTHTHAHGHGLGTAGTKGPYNPQALLAAVCRMAPQFKGRQQHDSHELMRLMLDALQEEEKRAVEMTRRRPSKDADADAPHSSSPPGVPSPSATASPTTPQPGGGASLLVVDCRASGTVAGGDDSLVSRLFGGELASRILCCSCGHSSVSTETFFDLSLPIPEGVPELGQQELRERLAASAAAAAGGGGDGGGGGKEGVQEGGGGGKGAAGKGRKLSKKEAKKEAKRLEKEAKAMAKKEKGRADDGKGEEGRGAGKVAAWQGQGQGQGHPEVEAEAELESDGQRVDGAGAGGGKEAARTAMAGFAKDSVKKMTTKEIRKKKQEERQVKIEASRKAKKQKQKQGRQEEEEEEEEEGGAAETVKQEATEARPSPDAPTLQEPKSEGPATLDSDSGGGGLPDANSSTGAAEQAPDRSAATAVAAPMGAAETDGTTVESTATSGGDAASAASPSGEVQVEVGGATAAAMAPPPPPPPSSGVDAAPSAPTLASAGKGAMTPVKSTAARCANPPAPLAADSSEAVTTTVPSPLVTQPGAGAPAAAATAPPPATAPSPSPSPPPWPPARRYLDVTSCLGAFFAAETVTWECPRERAEAADVASPSAAASWCGRLAATPLPSSSLRKQVSWSQKEPEVFLVPGSAEQRGTDLQEALRGDAPFFRPAKAHGASFVVQAQLDPFDTDSMYVQLLPLTGSSRAATLLAAAAATAAARGDAAAAAAAAATAGTSPAPLSPVLSTILGSSPRSNGGGGGLSMQRRRSSGGGGGATGPGPFADPGLPLGSVDVRMAWRYGSTRDQGRRMQAVAQLVMDCAADLMAAPAGLQHLLDMLAGGLELAEANTPPASPATTTKRAAAAAAGGDGDGGGGGKVRLLLRGKYPDHQSPYGSTEAKRVFGDVAENDGAAGSGSSGSGSLQGEVATAAKAAGREAASCAVPIAAGNGRRHDGTGGVRRTAAATWEYPTALRRPAENPAFAHIGVGRGLLGAPTPPSGSSPSSFSSSTAASSSESSAASSAAGSPADSDVEAEGNRAAAAAGRCEADRRRGPVSLAAAAAGAAATRDPVTSTMTTAAAADAGTKGSGASEGGAEDAFLGCGGAQPAVVCGLPPMEGEVAGSSGNHAAATPDLSGVAAAAAAAGASAGADSVLEGSAAVTEEALKHMHGINLDPELQHQNPGSHSNHNHNHHHHHHHHHHHQHHLANGPSVVTAACDEGYGGTAATTTANGTTVNGGGSAAAVPSGSGGTGGHGNCTAAAAADGDALFDMDDLTLSPSPSATSKPPGQRKGSPAAADAVLPPPAASAAVAPVAIAAVAGFGSIASTVSSAPAAISSIGEDTGAVVNGTHPPASQQRAPAPAPTIGGDIGLAAMVASPAAGSGATASGSHGGSGGGDGDGGSGGSNGGRKADELEPASGADSESDGCALKPRPAATLPCPHSDSLATPARHPTSAAVSHPIDIPATSPSSFSPGSRTPYSDGDACDGGGGSAIPLPPRQVPPPPPGSPGGASSAIGASPGGGGGGLRRSSGGGGGGLRRSSGGSFQRTSTKQYFLRRPPEVLVLHLKRFGMDNRGRLNKIDKHVAFETSLNLEPFLAAADAAATNTTAAAAGSKQSPSSTCAAASPVTANPAADATTAADARDSSTGGVAADVSTDSHTDGEATPFAAAAEAAKASPFVSRTTVSYGTAEMTMRSIPEPASAPSPSAVAVASATAEQLRTPQPETQLQPQPQRSALAAAVAEQSMATRQPCVYDLLGVVEHSGQLRYGHYVAYVKRSNPAAGNSPQWYYASDTQVRPVTEAQVLRAQAYILLYARRPQGQHRALG